MRHRTFALRSINRFTSAVAVMSLVLVAGITISPQGAVAQDGSDPLKPAGDASTSAVTVGATIASPGPLTTIATTPDLNCDVRYAGDISAEFYGDTACATLVAVGGVLYGPSLIPAGGSTGVTVPFTPREQFGPLGSGTVSAPFVITTTVDLGQSGISLTQIDRYVIGQESYSTTLFLNNATGSAASAVIYRAGDCYVANSDFGTGSVTGSSPACVSAGGRVEQWVPLTGGSSYIETSYSSMWAAIGTQQPFPNTCACDVTIDNGAGLSWPVSVPAGGSTNVAHLTAFSPDAQNPDTDGDGLLDSWETNGLDANGDGTVDVDLPAMGASPNHKDLFVEVDWMERPRSCSLWVILCVDPRSYAPIPAALADVVESMANSPVTNPDQLSGIRLHVDAGPNSVMNPVTGTHWGSASHAGVVPFTSSLGSYDGNNYDWSDFNALKSSSFDPLRADVFHYALYAETFAGSGSSGIAQGLPGDSFMITDGASGWTSSGFTRRQEAGTFIHELGHTLGLHHGGGDDINNKPNYLSVMNYLWQLQGRPVDFSRSALSTLNEFQLSESDGLSTGVPGDQISWYCYAGSQRRYLPAGANIDWNCSGTAAAPDINAGFVGADVTGPQPWGGDGIQTALVGHEDWTHLIYDGGAVGAFGAGDLNDQNPPATLTPVQEPPAQVLKDASAFGDDGDGSVVVAGPPMIAVGVGGQALSIDVTNIGAATSDYSLEVAGWPTSLAPVTVGALAGGATRRILIPVTAPASVGDVEIVATLSNVGGVALSSTRHVVSVVDLDDPATAAAAKAAFAALTAPLDGLDDQVRQALHDLLAANLPSGGEPSQPAPGSAPASSPSSGAGEGPTSVPAPSEPSSVPSAVGQTVGRASVTVFRPVSGLSVSSGAYITVAATTRNVPAGTSARLTLNGTEKATAVVAGDGTVVFPKVRAERGSYVVSAGSPPGVVTSDALTVSIRRFGISSVAIKGSTMRFTVATGAWPLGTRVTLTRDGVAVASARVRALGKPITLSVARQPGAYQVQVKSSDGLVQGLSSGKRTIG